VKKDGVDHTYIAKMTVQIVGRVGSLEPYIYLYKHSSME
jgi:hypothetical protein